MDYASSAGKSLEEYTSGELDDLLKVRLPTMLHERSTTLTQTALVHHPQASIIGNQASGASMNHFYMFLERVSCPRALLATGQTATSAGRAQSALAYNRALLRGNLPFPRHAKSLTCCLCRFSPVMRPWGVAWASNPGDVGHTPNGIRSHLPVKPSH